MAHKKALSFYHNGPERAIRIKVHFPHTPPSVGGLDLNSSNRGCARLGSEVAPILGVVIEEVAVLIVLVRRHRRAVGAAVRRAVGGEVPGAVEEETGPAAMRHVPQAFWMCCLYMPLVRLESPL